MKIIKNGKQNSYKGKINSKKIFIDHLLELKRRFYIVLVVFIIGSTIGFLGHEALINFILSPLNKPIYYSTPTGGFELIFQISVITGFFISLPIIFYNLIKFIEPALSKDIEKNIKIFIIFSFLLTLVGITLAYFFSLPAALNFLDRFNSDNVSSLITSNSYLAFVFRYLIGFALLFQIPIIIIFVNYVKPLKVEKLLSLFRYVIVLSFIIAAIITPTPDPFNQLILAFPIIFLYLLSICIIYFINKYKI